MQALGDIFAPLAISQLMLLGLFVLIHYRGLLAGLLALFCFCLSAYVLGTMPLVDDKPFVEFILFRFATLAPYLIWLIAYLLFIDDSKIKPAIWLAIGAFFLTRSAGVMFAQAEPELTTSPVYQFVVLFLPQLAMLGFSIHAIVLTFQGYSDDLVVYRRQFRVLFVVCMGIVITAVLGIGTFVQLQIIMQLEMIRGVANFPNEVFTFYIFVVSLVLNIKAFRLSEQALSLIPKNSVRPVAKPQTNGSVNKADSETISRLEALMLEEKLYTQPGLTIVDLAKRLSMQEYKLRRLINQSLQYRNFNQFLNHYRIEDASVQLRDSSAPVSSIALGVGYSSLSVFNKAFKDRFGMTPTEYRSSLATQ